MKSILVFDGNSTVTYTENIGNSDGGAIKYYEDCSITFAGNSNVIFSDNKANMEEQCTLKNIPTYHLVGTRL